MSTTEFHRLYTQDPRYRFELRTVNAPSWPKAPSHPRLIRDEAPTMYQDGTFGDRDYLYAPIPFDRKCIWIHYIPAMSMWSDPLPGYNFEEPPMFIKPRESDTRFWRVSAADPTQGKFMSELYSDLRTFWVNGLTHAYILLGKARDYPALPVDPAVVEWQAILESGPFTTMLRRFVALQRKISELYGWIMLQEKLQPDVASIMPHRRPLWSQGCLSSINHLMGVIVPWDDRSPSFDQMAIEHGVCLWWCDYATPRTTEMPAWRGLSKAAKEEVVTHRGSGFIAINTDPASRKFLVDLGESSRGNAPRHSRRKRPLAESSGDDHGQYDFPTHVAGRERGLEAPIPGTSSAPARPPSPASTGSCAEGSRPSTSTRPPVADMSPAELAAFRAESARRREAHELAGMSKARNPNKKPKKNRAQHQAARAEAEKRGSKP
ncbi:hypothetical protein BOTBODRAFT_182385 [Botryobasidium botryosum FD-172 SS1]|uniref:Uncharacterized protein n=1 Tax=Botryobasidium botryosum (strain FD-172 SS1) TaxID=930990 RepID=A0A067LRG9_BOTB1|nr:hypothetical protein BOTBODRAFT_182385 [Botryobasidium botryosum FD-172 SS1]